MSEEIWNQIYHYAQGKSERCIANDRISPRLYEEYGVNLEQQEFSRIMAQCRSLPTNFTRDVIMKASSADIMNTMTRSILTLASYDEKATDISVENSLRQCMLIMLITIMKNRGACKRFWGQGRDCSLSVQNSGRRSL